MASTVNPISVNVGIDFSLLTTKLHAVYEKREAGEYAVLLAPSEPTADKGVSMKAAIEDIKKLINGVDKEADTSQMETDMQKELSRLGDEQANGFNFDNLVVKLSMAYLYISKTGENSTVEYAFQLQIITEGVIPKEIKGLIDVDTISISIWNTQRKRITEQMGLVSVNEYLGISKQETEPVEQQS